MRSSSRNITLCAVVALGGCSQIIGLSDYEVEPNLGASAGETATEGGQGDQGGTAGTPAKGGDTGDAGNDSSPGGQPGGGKGGTGQGGSPATGGSAGNAGVGQAGDLGAGGEPSVVLPCTTAACCAQMGGTAKSYEMLQDGGFELGPTDGMPWFEAFTKDGMDYVDEAITSDTSLGFKPKAGAYYAYLSGIPGERASLYSEDLVVPADAGWFVLSGYRYFQIDKADATNADFALIAFYNLDNDPLEIPLYWAYDDPAGFGETNGVWKSFTATWEATDHAGQTRYLGVRGESDTYPATGTPKASSYLFDELSLKLFRCYL